MHNTCAYHVIPTFELKFPPVTTVPAQLFDDPATAGLVAVAGAGRQAAGMFTDALADPVPSNAKCSGNPESSALQLPV